MEASDPPPPVLLPFPSYSPSPPPPSSSAPLLQHQSSSAASKDDDENQKSSRRKSAYSFSTVIIPFLFPAIGGLLYGYDAGATSSALLSLESSELSGTDWFDLTSVEVGFLQSGSLYGAFLGSVLAFAFSNSLGRRQELINASIFYLFGSILTAGAPNFTVLLIGRFIYGFGIGMTMHGGPLYIAETCPVTIRGTLISTKEALIVCGMLLGYVIGFLAIEVVGGWRIMYGSSAPIALIMTMGMCWLPRSPRWILLQACKGKANMESSRNEAVHIIRRLMGKDANEDDIHSELDEILESLQLAREEVRISEIFDGTNLKALTIGIGLVLFQQFTGQPSVLYYASSIFKSAGFSGTSSAGVSVILGIFKILMTLIAVWKVDSLGRRPLLIGGVGLLTTSLFLLAYCYEFVDGIAILAVVALLLYVGAYQVSFGPIGWILLSEIFPLRVRGWASGISVLVNFGANAVVTFSFSPLQDAIGTAETFACFGIIGILALVFIVWKVPETKGLSLEEIEVKLSR